VRSCFKSKKFIFLKYIFYFFLLRTVKNSAICNGLDHFDQNVLVLVFPTLGRLQEEGRKILDKSLPRSFSRRRYSPQSTVCRRPHQASRCRPQHLLHQRPFGRLRGSSGVHRRLHSGVKVTKLFFSSSPLRCHVFSSTCYLATNQKSLWFKGKKLNDIMGATLARLKGA